MTEIIKNYCIGAARFWRAQAIPPNKLCSCFGFVCNFLFSGQAKNFSGVPHLPWRCRRPCWPKQPHWMQQPIAKLTSPGHALPRELYFLPWGKHWKGKKNWIRIQYLALPRHWTDKLKPKRLHMSFASSHAHCLFRCVVFCNYPISFINLVMCRSIYRFMSRVKCPKSPTPIRKFFEKYTHAAQHVFYISA